MAENIELHSYHTNEVARDSDIEEYHEINQEPRETAFSPKYVSKTLKDYDFFTQHDVKSTEKGNSKKKKAKKKERTSNLMDLISSELASVVIPIRENMITMVDYTLEQQNSYLERTPRALKIFQRKSLYFDSEQGWGKQDLVNLSPIFPRVLGNAVTEDNMIPVQYVEASMFSDLVTENYNIESKQSTKFLDIEIKDMKFKHHHQFSLERLLCNRLLDCYNDYNILQKTLKGVTKDIKVIRDTRDNLKRELLKIRPDKKEDIRFDATVRNYTGQLIQLKTRYLVILQKQKELIHNIISLWSDIEMVREKTENKETPYTAIITKTVQDEYEKEWNDMFNIEYSDMLDKMEFDYVAKYIEYRDVKYTQNLDDSAKRRMNKPKLVIDEDSIKEDVEILVNNIFPRDKIYITLKQDEIEIDKTKKSLIKHDYFIEIYVDDVFVCESDHFTSKNDNLAEIEFVECFSVQILSKNTALTLTLCENESKVANYKLNLSDIKVNNANAEFVTQNINYNDIIIEPNAKHIGSGYNIKQIAAEHKVRLKSSNIFKGNLYTTCEINIKMGWNEKLSQHQSEAIKSSMEIGRQLKRLLHGIDKPNTDILIDLISKIYGKEVSDENMINTLRSICQTEVPVDDTFPLDENSPEYIRLKLLHLRNIGGLNIENKMVPLHASQISTEQLNCIQKSNENEFEVQYFSDKYSDMDPIELQRHIGAKYVQKLNKNMSRNLNEYFLRKTHKDVVRDFKDLSLRSLFSNQTDLATLATISSSTKQQLLQEAVTKDQELRVNVVRAFNLMDRRALLEDEDSDEQIAGYKVRPLRPFVRVSYRGASTQTVSAIGCHPSWNQTLKITTKPDPLSSIHINIYDEHKSNITERTSDEESHRTVQYRYYNKWLGTVHVPLNTVLALGSLRGTFKLATPPMLFGYETLQTKDSTRSLVPEVTQLLKKDTSFINLHITTGISHLGGLQGYNQPVPSSDDDYLIKHLNNFVTEYLNNFPSRNITLTFIDSSGVNKCVTQFLQPIPLPDTESFPKITKNRSESALSKSSGLSKSSSSSSKRKEEEKISSQSGEERESLYSAYDAGSWRNGENQPGRLMDACLRYVSLIPTYEVLESHVVTLMGVELLKVLHGSPLDHTILLASYYLHLGIRCYVATGLSLPRGITSYVLTQHELGSHRVVLLNEQSSSRRFGQRNGYMWFVHDAVSGERSLLRDVECPLKTVQFVFDADNIWVNVHSSQDCESVSFDFSRFSDWQPVFDKRIFAMRQPVPSEPQYSAPCDLERLRHQLESKLKHSLQRWRPHSNTIWNRYCSSLLREMLPQWEYWSFHPSEPKPAPSHRLKQLMVSYKMFGFPLNMPYVNTKSVTSTVKSTGIHVCDDPNTEFALAVEVFAYPSNVISVWVFLTSITRL